MQPIRNFVHRSLRTFGWEVQRLTSLKKNQTSKRHQEQLHKWQFAKNHKPGTILDIGANEGQFATLIREILPNSKIYSFEPLPDCYKQLKTNSQEMHPHEVFPFALGNQNGNATINLNEFSPSSS